MATCSSHQKPSKTDWSYSSEGERWKIRKQWESHEMICEQQLLEPKTRAFWRQFIFCNKFSRCLGALPAHLGQNWRLATCQLVASVDSGKERQKGVRLPLAKLRKSWSPPSPAFSPKQAINFLWIVLCCFSRQWLEKLDKLTFILAHKCPTCFYCFRPVPSSSALWRLRSSSPNFLILPSFLPCPES